MHLLTPFTTRIERDVTRGRAVGNKTRYEFVVAADKYNWIVAKFVYDEKGKLTNEQGLKFFATFTTLLPGILRYADEKKDEFDSTPSAEDVFDKVNEALARVTDKPKFVPEKTITTENLRANGEAMTLHYEVNFCSVKDNSGEGTLTGRLFKKKKAKT